MKTKKILKEIECNKINPKSELRRLDMELAENVKREDFNPMELARGLSKRKELYEFEHPETKAGGDRKSKDGMRLLKDAPDKFTSETAKTIGKSETFVKEHLQLNDIKPELQKKVRDNQINKSQALAVHRKEKKIEKLKEEVKEIKAEELNLYEGDC